eukprot:scaffold8023_cov54-Attheya_sp.AAC.8
MIPLYDLKTSLPVQCIICLCINPDKSGTRALAARIPTAGRALPRWWQCWYPSQPESRAEYHEN